MEVIDEIRKIPIEDFFSKQVCTNYSLSPCGNYVAFLKVWSGQKNIFVKNVNSQQELQLSFSKNRNIDSYMWGSESKIIYTQDSNGDEFHKLYVIDRNGENRKLLTHKDQVKIYILDTLPADKNHVMVLSNQRQSQLFDVFKINIESGYCSLALENTGNYTNWLVDEEGLVRLVEVSDGSSSLLHYRNDADSAFNILLAIDYKDSFKPLRLHSNGARLYALSNIGRDKIVLVSYDIQSGEEFVIYEHCDVDLDSALFSKNLSTLVGISYFTWKAQQYFFDKNYNQMIQDIHMQLDNRKINLLDSDLNENIFLLETYSDRQPACTFLYQRDTNQLRRLDEQTKIHDTAQMVEMRTVKYQSRDGLIINAYLTLPKCGVGLLLPTVIMPHGGPWERDVWQYNPMVQFLANRGYAVFQMNYRGSTGYGRKFLEKGFKHWGAAMQNDITDGVYWLIDNGFADADRIAIFGGSYGGYATLAGLAHTPELYACGIDVAGVSDLVSFLEGLPDYISPILPSLYEKIGHPVHDKQLLDAVSPIYHAHKIKAPLLIAHGKNDPWASIDDADILVKTLREHNVEIKYLVNEDEGHSFYNGANRLNFYCEIEKFLDCFL